MRLLHRRVSERKRAGVDLVPWISWCFVIGSALFALGVPMSMVKAWPVWVSGTTFFVGSVFFTTAATLQLVGCVDEPLATGGRRAWVQVGRYEWWSDVSQWIGTLFFNVNTFRGAYSQGLSATAADQLIWVPDAVGSALFLISSVLACIALRRTAGRVPARDLEWRINAVNLAGSVLFGIAAVGAFVITETSSLYNARWANVGTAAGAVCFLVAAWWLRADDPGVADPASATAATT